MKFVTLALATLLALGCQAASVPAKDPMAYLADARARLSSTIDLLEQTGRNIAARVNDPDTRQMLEGGLGSLVGKVKALREQAEPLTDSTVKTIYDATEDLRTKLGNDWDALQKELETPRAELRDTVEKHVAAYREKLTPFFNDYQAAQETQMATLKAQHENLMTEMRDLINTNVAETKGKLTPILEILHKKAGEHFENLKAMAGPYVNEYREQMVSAFQNAQAQVHNIDQAALAEKAQAHYAELKTCFDNLAEKVKTAMA